MMVLILILETNAFITGDAVYYSYNNNIGLIFQEGQYFIYKVNAFTIRLATSRSNIRSQIFIIFGTVTGNKLELLRNTGKQLRPQNLIRKFADPIPSTNEEEKVTVPGSIGMFVNGVEISNFKSSDAVYFGPIKSIDVTSIGDGQYDVINPPILQITDTEPSVV